MKKVFGYGIIGCGEIAHTHAKALAILDDARLVGAFDISESVSKSFSERYDCKPAASLSELLSDKDIDVVNICTPSGHHLEPALAALEAGKNVVVEKPLEITLERCEQIIREAENRHLLLSTIFPARFRPAYRWVKELLRVGAFGNISLMAAYVKWFRDDAYFRTWRGTTQLDGGGCLMNQGIHSADLFNWFLGRPDFLCSLNSNVGHPKIDVEDTCSLVMQYSNGTIATLEISTSSYPGTPRAFEVTGTKGTLKMTDNIIIFAEFSGETPAPPPDLMKIDGRNKSAHDNPSNITHEYHAAQFADVNRALKSGTAPLISGPDGRNAVEIVRSAYQSNKERAWIDLQKI